MSISVWCSYNNLAFKINPGPDWKDDKEKLKLILGKIPIYQLDKFSHWEVEKSKLNRLFEVYGNKILIQPDAQEYINYYKLQTTDVLSLPKTAITVKSLDGKVLDPYQEDYVSIYDKRLGLLGLMEMSAGKTLCSLLRAANLGFEKLIVICPAEILEDWKSNIEEILGLQSIIYTGAIPKKKRQTLDLESTQVIVCNYEMVKELNKLSFDSIIIDEAHIPVGGGTSKLYKELKKLVRKNSTASVQALTATPIEDNIVDLWCLINLVNPELAGDRDSFLNKFQEPTLWINLPNPRTGETYRKAVKFRTKNQKELKGIIRKAGMRIGKEHFLKVKNNVEVVSVRMTESQSKLYEEIRTELLIQAKDKLFFLSNPLTKLTKTLQACEGTYNFYPEIQESGKLTYIQKELEEAGKSKRKVIIWFRYLEGSEILHSWYPNSSVLVNGNQSPAKKFLAKVAFQGAKNEKQLAKFNALKEKYNFPFEAGSALFLISTYNERSGIGSNYQKCDVQYYMSYDFSATAFNQSQARIVRRDSLFDNVYTKLIVSADTIEPTYIRMILTKIENQSNLLDGISSSTSITARDIVRILENV